MVAMNDYAILPNKDCTETPMYFSQQFPQWPFPLVSNFLFIFEFNSLTNTNVLATATELKKLLCVIWKG